MKQAEVHEIPETMNRAGVLELRSGFDGNRKPSDTIEGIVSNNVTTNNVREGTEGEGAGMGCSVEEDTALLKTILGALTGDLGAGTIPSMDDVLSEVVRCGAGEIHCVASFMGGIASQEAIKLITRQFVPLPATLIYNGMASTTSLFRF